MYVRNLALELGHRGVTVDIFTRQASAYVEPVERITNTITVHHVPAGPPTDLAKQELATYVPDFGKRVRTILRNNSYDIVHSHYWLSGWSVIEAGLEGRIPWVHMSHTWAHLKNKNLHLSQQTESSQRLRAESLVAAKCDLLIVSTPSEQLFATWFYGVQPERIRVVPCGVDSSTFFPGNLEEAKTELGIGPENPVVAFVGRLDAIKGLDILLRSVRLLQDRLSPGPLPQLLVIGGESTPGELERLKGLADGLGLSGSVHFLGPIPHSELPRYYRASDVVVLPSLYESFGMALLEAMACGVPVVASRVDGPAHFVRHGVTGFLVPPGDERALATAMETLLVNPELRRDMARNAVRTVYQYRWEAVGEGILRAYADALCPIVRQARAAV